MHTNRESNSPAIILALLAAGMAIAANANGAVVAESVYFDINFSSPPHRIGSPPAVNAGTATPTANVFGRPEVVSSFGALTKQPVVLNTAGNVGPSPYFYDQFILTLGHKQPTYHLSFDLYTVGLIGSTSQFSVIMDIPTAAKLGFYPNGTMYPPCWPGPSPLPGFTDETLMHIDISLDIPNNRSVTLVNGVVIGDGQAIGGASSPRDLSSVRFSIGYGSEASVGIDNIRVTNGFLVPECGVSAFVMLSTGVLLTRRGCRH